MDQSLGKEGYKGKALNLTALLDKRTTRTGKIAQEPFQIEVSIISFCRCNEELIYE